MAVAVLEHVMGSLRAKRRNGTSMSSRLEGEAWGHCRCTKLNMFSGSVCVMAGIAQQLTARPLLHAWDHICCTISATHCSMTICYTANARRRHKGPQQTPLAGPHYRTIEDAGQQNSLQGAHKQRSPSARCITAPSVGTHSET
eukprot:355134-Chlamydomonas_euryale.AAC.1